MAASRHAGGVAVATLAKATMAVKIKVEEAYMLTKVSRD